MPLFRGRAEWITCPLEKQNRRRSRRRRKGRRICSWGVSGDAWRSVGVLEDRERKKCIFFVRWLMIVWSLCQLEFVLDRHTQDKTVKNTIQRLASQVFWLTAQFPPGPDASQFVCQKCVSDVTFFGVRVFETKLIWQSAVLNLAVTAVTLTVAIISLENKTKKNPKQMCELKINFSWK